MKTIVKCLSGMLFVIIAALSLSHPTEYIQADFGLTAGLVAGLLSLLMTGYSTYSAVDSQKKAAKEGKKYQKELEKRRSDYDAWFNSEYNRDFLDTDLGHSMASQIGNTLKNTINVQQNAAVRGGATPEAQVASQGAAQDVFADAVNKLTAQGANYKLGLRNSYDYRLQNYLQPLDQYQLAKMNNYTNLGAQTSQATQGLTNALAMYDWGV